MAETTWPNLAAMFFDQARRLGDKPLFWAKKDGAYESISWRGAAATVGALAGGLKALGVVPGDRVQLVSENRPEWALSDLAVMTAGAITVPAYVTNTPADHLHVLTDSGAKGVIVSTRVLAERVLSAAGGTPDLEFVITMEPVDQVEGVRVLGFEEVQDMGGTVDGSGMAGQWKADDLACILYTSGTGGAPKGVMLEHRSIFHNCAGSRDALHELGLGDEVFLCFLPLSHSYEHTAGQFFPLTIGAQIYYAEGVEQLSANMAEARPTIMTAVPRLYENMHERIMRGVRKSGGVKEKLFMTALELGSKRLLDPSGLSLAERLADAVVERLVRDKVRARFGGRLKALVSGGAPLNPEIGLFFTALGLRILQGYGQTESAPVISVNRPGDVHIETVGPPMKDVEVRIAGDGEILVRGDLVMRGYWRNEQATDEVIRDGWLYTGDVGEVDENGCLRITDRKKDIIVNSGGDNIAPQRIEGILIMEPEIHQAMVMGDARPHLVGLLVPDRDWMGTWAKEHGKDTSLLADDGDFRAALSAVVGRVNEGLSVIERVRSIVVAEEAFTIDNGLMTPTLKLRRFKIIEIYGNRLEALYR
jgi:long-chain acyl-CoA synthetase